MDNDKIPNDLITVMKEIRDTLKELIVYAKTKDKVKFIPRKDFKSLFRCSDITVAKIFEREDFPAIMIGEHKVEEKALKNWCQKRRI